MTLVALLKYSFLLENKENNNYIKETKMRIYKEFLIVLILASVLMGSGFAQRSSIKNVTDNEYALKNLVAGIQSDNTGVKRSAIYFAGKYRIAEVEDVLINQLNEEDDASTRILIALVLFEMGSEEGLVEVQELSLNDEDAKVRRMATQIFNEYLVNDTKGSLTSK